MKKCWVCGRRGSRWFHKVTWGKHVDEWRCDSYLACERRKIAAWSK